MPNIQCSCSDCSKYPPHSYFRTAVKEAASWVGYIMTATIYTGLGLIAYASHHVSKAAKRMVVSCKS